MKKMKKFFAMLLTLAMVMGLSLTAFAEGNASITVKGLVPGENTELKLYKVVELDAEHSTWKVTNDAYAPFVTLTGDPAVVDWEGLEGVLTGGTEVTTTADKYEFTGLDIGLYAITASGTDATTGDPTTTYNIMGTNTYDYDTTTNLIVADDKEITAKGANYTITKTLSDGTQVFVRNGDEVQFDITMVFPSYGQETTNRTFNITDTPTGMKVKSVDSVTVGGTAAALETDYTVTALGVANQAVTVNFTSSFIGTENTHAGQTVVVTLTAVVTDDTEYSNSATSNMTETPSTVEGNSGYITINKLDEDNNALTGARFKVGETVNEVYSDLEFVFVDEVNGVATYTLKTDDVTGEAVTELGTETASTIVVKGLGAGTYEITEAKAPEGYSVVDVDDVTLTAETRNGTANVTDTRLASLPSTGGIGTTIFTVGGCAIMIIAAGLYFSLRRRTAK